MVIFIICAVLAVCLNAEAFWIWTPESSKLINPKYAAKDTPQEQYDWAMSFFVEEDYKRAAEEFVRLVDVYGDSKQAPDAQYYAAYAYHQAGKYYIAFQNYQKVIEQYPYTDRIGDIIKAEYELGQLFYERSKAVLMGVELMTDVEKSIEIFSAILKHMPYSTYADKAQYMLGMAHKKIQQYNQAIDAFHIVVQEYPKSELIEQSKYEIAQCLFLASKKADYDQEATDEAIKEFKQYAEESGSETLREEAENTISQLKEKKAAGIFDAAYFYERQKKYRSAVMYYKDIIENFPATSYRGQAEERLKKILPKTEERTNEK